MAIIRTRAPIQECARHEQTWRWRRRWCGKYSSTAAARKCRVRAAAAHARCVFPAARDAELALDNGRAINGGGRGATRNLRAGRSRCRRRCVAASPASVRPSFDSSLSLRCRRAVRCTKPRPGWRRGVVASGVGRMNEVNARRARLVPGWVTVFGRV